MSITRIGSGSAEATTVTIPAGHQLGDILLIFSFRDGNTTGPTLPAGWTNIGTAGANTCSYRAGWKIAVSSSDTSGTWTNATGLMVHVYRGVDVVTPFGTLATSAAATSPSTYGITQGVGLDIMDNQWFVAFQGHRSIDTTTMNNAPTGYINVINAQTGATNNMVSFDTNAPVQSGFASNTVAPGGTASGWRTLQLPMYPAMQRFTNYQQARSISAGIISVGEKLR